MPATVKTAEFFAKLLRQDTRKQTGVLP